MRSTVSWDIKKASMLHRCSLLIGNLRYFKITVQSEPLIYYLKVSYMVFMPHWPKPLGFRPEDFSLLRIREVLAKLGNPELKMPRAIHVAGTNGKGSTISFLQHIMQEAGYRVHVYTSPHLLDFNERIVLAGHKISDNRLYEVLEECRKASDGVPITFFEATTIAAFLAFSQVAADIALIETGMGGRLDATNVISPIMTIITSISLEHTAYLGPTVEIIAGEKSGIIKPATTCIVAPQQDSVMKVIEYYAQQNQAPIYRGGIDWHCQMRGSQMIFRSQLEELTLPQPNLQGDHQVINAGNAIASCSVLMGKHHYDIDYDHICSGLQKAYWPARLELITDPNLPPKWQLFLDGAHNPAGAEAMANWLQKATDAKEISKVHLIVGMTDGKDTEAFLGHLKPYIQILYAVCVKSEPRSQPAEKVANTALAMDISAIPCESIKEAIDRILMSADRTTNQILLICGSLFLAGDLHNRL